MNTSEFPPLQQVSPTYSYPASVELQPMSVDTPLPDSVVSRRRGRQKGKSKSLKYTPQDDVEEEGESPDFAVYLEATEKHTAQHTQFLQSILWTLRAIFL